MSALMTDPYRKCSNCGLRCGVWPKRKCPNCGTPILKADREKAKVQEVSR